MKSDRVEGLGTILRQKKELGEWGEKGWGGDWNLDWLLPCRGAPGARCPRCGGAGPRSPPAGHPATQSQADLLEEKRGSGLVPYHPVAEALFRMVSW